MCASSMSTPLMMDCGVMLFSFVGDLLGAAAIGFADGLVHGVGAAVGVENGAAFDVARATADGLNQRCGAAEKSFLVRVENGDEGDFRQIQPLAKKIDADEDVEF